MSPHISPYLSTSGGRDGTCFLGAFSKPFPQACTSSLPYLPPISLYLPAGVHELLGAINQRIVRAAMAALDCGDMAALGALTEEAQGTSTTRP